MFSDIQHFQELHGQAGLGHHVGFKIPIPHGHHHRKHHHGGNCYPHKSWCASCRVQNLCTPFPDIWCLTVTLPRLAGRHRPWAKDQGDGYMRYDNQLFWDHG